MKFLGEVMIIATLLKGILVGFTLAIPVGPVAIFVIRKTLHYGRFAGLASSLGIATADFFYATIAAFGFAAASDYLVAHRQAIDLFGGIVLILVGIQLFMNSPQQPSKTSSTKTIIASYISSLLLTLSNPMTILMYIAIFSAFYLTEGATQTITILVLGIFLGSLAWFTTLTEVTYSLRTKFSTVIIQFINKVSGVIMAVIGGGIVLTIFLKIVGIL
jgi:threonine/homoserine/homoserine lactone efflux protein